MKKVAYLLFISLGLLSHNIGLAQKTERFVDSLPGSNFRSGVELTTFHPRLHEPTGRPHPEQRKAKLRNANGVLMLEWKGNTVLPSDLEVRIKANVTGRGLNGRELRDENVTLTVQAFRNGDKTDRIRDGWNAKGLAWLKVKIRDVDAYRNGKKTDLRETSPADLLSLLSLRLELETATSYANNPNEKPVMERNTVHPQTGNIDLQWRSVPWADFYELEWMHVPDYGQRPGQLIPATALAVPAWRFQSTRVAVSSTSYSVSSAYESGYLIYRIRAVARNSHFNNQHYYGPWQFPERAGNTFSGKVAGVDPTHFTRIDARMVMGNDRMNWQFMADYREEGQRSEVVSFYDGTLRSRQTISRDESGGVVLASQPVYDHQGRQAITMPSTPVMQREGGSDPYVRRLNWQGNLAVDASGNLYDRNDFDTDAFFNNCNPVRPTRMGSQRGAARYYSPENPDQSGAQAFLPDAGGFPFIRTQWADDQTRRLVSVGSLGADLQPGSGHEMRFRYALPSQTELDMLFGNDAGPAAHYSKLVSMDANGQQTITYKNLEDKVVATALVGDTPEALTDIGGQRSTLYVDFNSTAPQLSPDGLVLRTSGYIHTSIDQVTTQFSYRFRPDLFRQSFCGKNYCTDCRYQLSIEVRNDCGDILHQINRTIRRDDIDCAAVSGENIDLGFDVVLPVRGVYSVYKTLSVDTSGFEQHFQGILADTTCRVIYPPVLTVDQVSIDCNLSCAECEEQARRIPDSFEREKMLMICMGICDGSSLSPAQLMHRQMLNDLRPGGQYALWRDTTGALQPDPAFPYAAYPLSVLNAYGEKLLGNERAFWKFPVTPYLDERGRPDSLVIPCGGDPDCVEGRRGRPNELLQLSDFIRNWKDRWAESLLPYHPEYAYYRYMDSVERVSGAFSLERRFRNTLTNTVSYRAARDSSFLSLENDPGMLDQAVTLFGIQAALTDRLQRYQPKPGGQGFFKLSEYVYLTSRCAFYPDNQREECMRQPLGPGIGNTGSDSIDNRDWNIYRALYLKERNRLIDSVVRRYMIEKRLPLNDCIGDAYCNLHYEGAYPLAPAQHLYAGKQKRYPKIGENYDNIPVNTLGNDEQDAAEIIAYAGRQDWDDCARCPQAVQLEGMLASMAATGILARPHLLNREIVVPPPLVEPLGIRGTAQWVPMVTPSKELVVQIRDAKGRKLCDVKLMPVGDQKQLLRFEWRSVRFIDCLKQTDGSRAYASESNKKNFTLKAYDSAFRSVMIEGHISCLDLTDCEAPRNCTYTCALESYNVLIAAMLSKSGTASRGLIRSQEVDYRRLEECLLAGRNEAKIDRIEYSSDQIRIHYTWKSLSGNNQVKLIDTHCDIELPKLPLGGMNRIELLKLEPMAVGRKECSTNRLMGTFRISNPKNRAVVQREVKVECAPYVTCCVPYTAGKSDDCCTTILPPPPIVPQQDCAARAEELVNQLNSRRRAVFVDSLRRALLQQYIDHAVEKAKDHFEANYQDRVHHFTLYYYDQAGNLVKTVSPAGVQLLDAAALQAVRRHREEPERAQPVYPAHTMLTEYQYDSQDQIIWKRSVDAGVTRNWFDRLGRVMLSQQASQESRNAYSYTLYDALGRVQETGEWNSNRKLEAQDIRRYAAKPEVLRIAIQEQLRRNVVHTHFDRVLNERTGSLLGQGPFHHRGRATSTLKAEVLDPQVSILQRYDHASHMRYDVHGNVNRLVVEFSGTGPRQEGALVKQVDYTYGIVSGMLKEVRYQEGKEDAFWHRYQYAASGKLENVFTSRNGYWWDRDIRNQYYRHGQLSRLEIGQDDVQGLDMLYTLQGWLKAVNHPLSQADPGGDGQRNRFAKDVYCFSLGYHQKDYRAIGGGAEFPFVTGTSDAGIGLFDGNIRSLVQYNGGLNEQPVHGSVFRYDQLGRLTAMERQLPQNGSWQPLEAYKTTMSYDPDGNILSMFRRGKASQLPMDDLRYTYRPGTHQLSQVQDDVSAGAYPEDIDSQEADNYQYDASGNLVADRSVGIEQISWTNDGKVAGITKGRMEVTYGYDANGYRVLRTDKKGRGFYVRDLKGRILAEYASGKEGIVWKQTGLFSTDQIGTYVPHAIDEEEGIRALWIQFRGQKRYELKNHLSDVMVVVSDKKESSEGMLKARILTAEDRYPFGSPMPDRVFNAGGYRFGYNAGSEKADELYGEGNGYSTLYRILDTRLGRWWSVDPMADDLAPVNPYTSMNNNPVAGNDPNGDFLNVVVGAVVGAAMEAGTQMISNAIDPDKSWYQLDYKMIAVSTVEGALTSGISSSKKLAEATVRIGVKAVSTQVTKAAVVSLGVETTSSALKNAIAYEGSLLSVEAVKDIGQNVAVDITVGKSVGKVLEKGFAPATQAVEAVAGAVQQAIPAKKAGILRRGLDKVKGTRVVKAVSRKARKVVESENGMVQRVSRKAGRQMRKTFGDAAADKGMEALQEVAEGQAQSVTGVLIGGTTGQYVDKLKDNGTKPVEVKKEEKK